MVSVQNKKWFQTVIVSWGHFWSDLYANMLPPLLPFICGMWELSNTKVALIVSIQSVIANFLQPFLGFIIDKDPQKWSLNFAILLTAVPMCFIYLAENYIIFILMVALAAIGSAIFHPLGATKAVENASLEDRALKMSLFSSLGNLGFAISPALTAYLVSVWGLKALTLMVIPGIIFIVFVLINKAKNSSEHTGYTTTLQTEEKFKFDNYRPLLVLSSIVALRSWLIAAISVFVPLWLVSQGASEQAGGLNLTYFLLAGTLGGFVMGYIYPRTGGRKLLLATFSVSLLLLPIYLYSSHVLRVWILCLLGFFLAGTIPVTIVIGQELLPTRAGLASGMTMGLAYGLGGLGISFTGIAADTWGIPKALLITSLSLVVAIVLTIILASIRDDIARSRKEMYREV